MISLTINGVKVQAEKESTILEVARLYGFNIPTLCYHDTLTPYGACRLCMVEVSDGHKTRLVASCLYPVQEPPYNSIALTVSASQKRPQTRQLEVY